MNTPNDPNEYWNQLAAMALDALGPLIQELRDRGDAKIPPDLAERLSDVLTPMMWQTALLGAAGMPKARFLKTMGVLYDQAEIAVKSGQAVANLIGLFSPRAKA